MINENTIKTLNIRGENILKNDNNSNTNCSISDLNLDSIDNYIINSNLDNTNIIK